MKIGILSDTHDNLSKIKDAVEILNAHKVSSMLHAGDFIAPFSLNPLGQLNCDWVGVFGNCDGEKKGLKKGSLGRIKAAPYFLELESKRIALMHKFKDVDAPIIIFGHTHKVEIHEEQRLTINPGEAGGWLTGKSSLVILDLDSLKPEVIYF